MKTITIIQNHFLIPGIVWGQHYAGGWTRWSTAINLGIYTRHGGLMGHIWGKLAIFTV